MPRLTNHDYLEQRQFLLEVWNSNRNVFTILPYAQQLELHGFYALTKKLNDKDAVLHRQLVTADHPSLPHRAGKLYLRIRQALKPSDPGPSDREPTQTKAPRGQRGRIRIHSLARSDIKVDKLAQLLLEVAIQRDAERRANGKEA